MIDTFLSYFQNYNIKSLALFMMLMNCHLYDMWDYKGGGRKEKKI